MKFSEITPKKHNKTVKTLQSSILKKTENRLIFLILLIIQPFLYNQQFFNKSFN